MPGCSRIAMIKLVEFTRTTNRMAAEGASDEAKQAFVSEYRKTLEPQPQLPLLFQTMTQVTGATYRSCHVTYGLGLTDCLWLQGREPGGLQAVVGWCGRFEVYSEAENRPKMDRK